MLNNKQKITDMGLLADIAYSEYGGVFIKYGEVISAVEDSSLALNSSYTVIDYTSHWTDMQAILLEKNDSGGNSTGKYVIAFRGTEPNSARDWISNGLTGLINYNPQVSAGKSFVLEMMSEYSISADRLTLTGHSLGGIVTQAVGADLHIQGYSFNPYGANLLSTLPPMPLNYLTVLGHVLDLFGLGDKNDQWIKDNLLTVLYQDNGSLNGDILSNLLTGFSEIIAGNDHLGGVLPIFGDNVGLLNGHGIPGLNTAINRYNEILSKFTGETTYTDLSTAYLLAGKDGFNSVNQTLSALQIDDVPDGNLSLKLFADSPTGDLVLFSSNEIQSLAQSDIAYRYALVHLNPFAVLGVDYSRFNQNGELDLFNPTTGQGLGEQYLEDRAKFLALKNELAVADATYGPINLPELEGYYVDRSTGLFINNTEYSTRETAPEFIFGSDGVDVIESFRSSTLPISRDDHVFGGAGNDIIRTYEGDDYLEGGPGQDSMDGGKDNDTFYIQGTDTDYDIFRGGPGTDTILGSNGDDTIRVHKFTGEDTVEVIDGGEGFDVIAGTDGADIIDLTGTSLISIERIEGGKGNDTILGSMGNDTIHGGEDDDVITGNKGDDLLVGGPGRDVYVYAEGDGHDTIIDSGDNLIQLRLADGSIVPVAHVYHV